MFQFVQIRHLEPPWHELDPDIAYLVRVLHEAGFRTTDSGDGFSKVEAIAAGHALPYAHVFAVVEPEHMVDEARRLLRLLRQVEEGADLWRVEASFDPDDDVAVLAVTSRAHLEST